MAAINRRSLACPIGIPVVLAAQDDLDGNGSGSKMRDITGALRALIVQINHGDNDTAGIDCIEVSHDGGATWYADQTTALLVSANDVEGTLLVDGTMNEAGVEPATVLAGIFKVGPYEGPTLIRIGRDTDNRGVNGTGTDWVSGAPAVYLIPIGLTAGSAGAIAFPA